MAEAATPEEVEAVLAVIKQYGLTSLWQGVEDYLQRGYTDANQILQMVSNDSNYQNAFYQRFPAIKQIREENQKRAAQGLPSIPELTAAEYVSDEWAYEQATRDLGAQYATKENITQWIVGQTSPTEVRDRIDVARQYIEYDINPEVRKELRDIYGLTDQEMVDYVLADPRRQEALATEFEARQRQANTRAAARVQGVNVSQDLMDQVAAQSDQVGSFGNASMIFSNVAAQAEDYRRLGDLSGYSTSTDDLVKEQFNLEGGTATTKLKKKLASQERARFNRSSAIGANSLSTRGLGTQ